MRTVLYANKDVSRFLSDNFVLLWTSERPVPKVTIDFGDGRTLERTVTGNAVHYVLDAEGRPLDALPGLYGPQAFLEALAAAARLHTALRAEGDRDGALRTYHVWRAGRIQSLLDSSVDQVEERASRPRTKLEAREIEFLIAAGEIPAELAVARAGSKSGVESAMVLRLARFDAARHEKLIKSGGLDKVVADERERIGLDSRSIAVMARELPGLRAAAPTAWELRNIGAKVGPGALAAIGMTSESKMAVEAPIARAVERVALETSLAEMALGFLKTLAEDTARNEYEFHARIHSWFMSGEVADLQTLNERVYREIFLTPRSDPWLGLGAEGVYTGTSGGGRR